MTTRLPRRKTGETLAAFLWPIVGWLTLVLVTRRPSDVEVLAACIFLGRDISAAEAVSLGLSKQDAKRIVDSATFRYQRTNPEDTDMAGATVKTLHDAYWAALP